jgi:hypothetical protein
MSTNPVVDYHIVYALVLIALALTYAGNTWGLGRLWARLPFVQCNRHMRLHSFAEVARVCTEAASASSDPRTPSAKTSRSGQTSRSATRVMLNCPA